QFHRHARILHGPEHRHPCQEPRPWRRPDRPSDLTDSDAQEGTELRFRAFASNGAAVSTRPRTPRGARRYGSMRNKQKGFSLIELHIVVAIIEIIAAIRKPNLIRFQIAANEPS